MTINEHRYRGQLDALQGKPCYYGCHTGMRSTLERDKAEYTEGWTEVEYLLRRGDTNASYEGTGRQRAISIAKANATEAMDQLSSNPNAIEDYMDNMRDSLAGLNLTPTEIWFAEDAYRRATGQKS